MLKAAVKSIFAFTVATLLWSCVGDAPAAGTTPDPEQVTVTEYHKAYVSGFSGVCINEAADGLYGVSDNGSLYDISFDGILEGALPFVSSHDFEGVSVDSSDGSVYLCEERERAIYKLSADKKSLSKIAAIDVPGGELNLGLEGIACDGAGNIYVANQASPTRIYKYSIAQGKVIATTDIDFAVFLSDLWYDSATATLWVLDSASKRITNITADGTVVQSRPVGDIDKPEGLCIDRARGKIWLSSDSTGYLYSIEL